MAKNQSQQAKIYLFFYNILQFVGWSYGLYQTLTYFSRTNGYLDVWLTVGYSVTFFQTLQLIEVLHCVVGLVPSSWFLTLIQIASRLFVVWGILLPVPQSINSFGVPMILVCWSIAEMTRYLYYALNIYDSVPKVLTWARYSFFIVLYPSGVSGELITMTKAFPYIRDSGLFSFSLPNFANISFYYHYLLVLVMLSYIPFFPQLFFYMLGQRKKILNPKSAASSGATKKVK